MKLPGIKITLPILFVLWCAAGVYVFGPVMLTYPAMWAGVGLLFVALNIYLKKKSAEDPSTAE